MNSTTAAIALQGLIIANLATLNSNADLIASGYSFRSDPTPDGANDSSPYLYFKIGDRGKLQEGLTVCLIPRRDTVLTRMTQYQAIHEVTVTVACYLKVEADPHKATIVLAAASEALSGLVAKTHAFGAYGNCKVGDQLSGGLGDSSGTITKVSTVDWTAEYISNEA